MQKHRSSLLAAVMLLAFASPLVSAQSAETFEVASVRRSLPEARFRSSLDNTQFTANANSLLLLIMSTYPDIPSDRVTGGHAWLRSEFWDVAAKLPAHEPWEEKELNRRTEHMLEQLLAERFRLVVHRETRDQQVYLLVQAKDGAKLKPSTASQFSVRATNGRFEFQRQSMLGLSRYLCYSGPNFSQPVDRTVIDQTGLAGFFDFTLEWMPDTASSDSPGVGQSIYSALEKQLGLKLKPEKSPLEYLVIDHAERPGEN